MINPHSTHGVTRRTSFQKRSPPTGVSRREALRRLGRATVTTCALSSGAFPAHWVRAQDRGKKESHILFLTKSSGYEHGVVRRQNGQLSHAEKVFIELGRKHGFKVTASKDGGLFDKDLSQFDAFFFYTSGDLLKPGAQDKSPPMSSAGKKALLEAVRAGKGFIGSHCANDTFHSAGPRFETQKTPDPFIAMLGGEFIRHGAQQKARMRVVDSHFPGCQGLGAGFDMHEEWYSIKNFAPDLHVLLVQETAGMKGSDYQRPPFPATWARQHGKGRVFYTSMGHREDVWTSPTFENVLLGGVSWVLRNVEADISPNMLKVAPKANVLPPPPPPRK